jgi:hypothetical protein
MFNNKFTAKDPLVDSVKKVMEQNARERQATAAVNEKFGIQDRKALPHERQGEWDAAFKSVLSEGVESLNETSDTKDDDKEESPPQAMKNTRMRKILKFKSRKEDN